MVQSLYIVNYSQGPGQLRHWGLFIGEKLNTAGTLHHVRSYQGSNDLKYAADENSKPFYSKTYRQSRWLADLSDSEVTKAEKCFRELDFDASDHSLDCQDWCLEALEALETENIVESGTRDKWRMITAL